MIAARLAAALTALLLCAGACSNDVCEEAYDKMESCVSQLNCNKLDPVDRDKCVKAKSAWDPYAENRSSYVAACGADSKLQTEADKIAGCALDPKTCTCP